MAKGLMNEFSANDLNLQEFFTCCRRHGLKITPQRTEVYKILLGSADHPSAETVYQRAREILPNISLDTVNRTLATLVRIGAAFMVEGCGDVKRFDADMRNHQHFKCVSCKRIIDFSYKPFENVEVPAELSRRFKVLRAMVYVEGLCEACQASENQ